MAESRTGRAGIVVVPWDGSPAASTAFPVARILAKQLGANVEVVRFMEEAGGDDAIRGAVHEQGLDEYAFRVYSGDAAAGILDAAGNEGVQLLILTTHGRDIEEGRRLGRVAERVIAHTSVPILLVRPEAPAMERQVERLLLPVDGAPRTAAALHPAMDLAVRLGARIDLLYVAPRAAKLPTELGSMAAPRYVDQKHLEWPAWAQEVVDRLAVVCADCPPALPIEMYLAHGDVGREIERFAIEHGSDAVVLVRRSHLQTGRARILRAVLSRAPCPTLICSGTNAD